MRILNILASLTVAVTAAMAHGQALSPSQSAALENALTGVNPGKVRLIVHTQQPLGTSLASAFGSVGWPVVSTPPPGSLRPCVGTSQVCLVYATSLPNARLVAINAALVAAGLSVSTLALPDITYDWPRSNNATDIALDIQ